MRTAAIAFLVAVLAGCGTTQTVTVPKEVKVPVPTACIDPKEVPQPPKVRSDAELLALDGYQRTIAVWVDRIELQIYKDKAAAIIEACSRIPPPKLRAGN